MGNDSFENKLEQELNGLQIQPSAAVWQQVEIRIRKEKKRRVFFWWFFLGIVMAGVGMQFLEQSEDIVFNSKNNTVENNTPSLGTIDATEKKKNPNASVENETNNILTHDTPINASIKIPSNDEVTNSKPINMIDEYESGKNEHLFVTENQDSRINKAFIEQRSIQIVKTRIDTIIVLRCEDIGKNSKTTENSEKLDRKLNFYAFYSFHGTGDLEGTKLEFGMEKRWGKRYGFYNNLGLTIHSGQELSSQYPLSVNSTYKNLQTVTAGIQSTPTLYRYSKRGDLKLGAGLVARYQASSSSDYGATSMGAGTNQYSFRIYHSEPNSFSIGYCISAELLLFERKKNQLGFQAFFQNDTRGDVITGFGLTYQTKYKK
jgi:hypothetical protein